MHWELNPEQGAAVQHPAGPLLIVAGAGTGKTLTMAHRAAALLHHGVAPARLLLLTFTRRAAAELARRVAGVLDQPGLDIPWCGTFHSVAARLLRRHGRLLDIDPAFSILDEADTRELFGRVAEERYPGHDGPALPGKALLARVHSYHINARRTPADALGEIAPDFLAVAAEVERLFGDYAARKAAARALDFDDLLLAWLRLLQAPGQEVAGRFAAILVDEYQDTNPIQADILRELCRCHGNITVVGDDAQAIYGFRGATVENILAFPAAFPGTAQVTLTRNYRSGQEILDAANALWSETGRGFAKELTAARGHGARPRLECPASDWEQAERVVQLILDAWQAEGVPLAEQAVLFRASHHSFPLETKLQRYGIPFRKYGGQRFAESAHIKDVVAFLRCRENPRDEPAWRRVFALLPGIGPATAARLAAQTQAAAAPATALAALRFPKAAQAHREAFLDAFAHLFGPDEPLGAQIAAVLRAYLPLLPLLYDLPDVRESGLHELQQLAARYGARREFLDDLQVGDDSLLEAEGGAPADTLTLSTIHSAKGCEWRHVILLQLIEGGLPATPSQDDAGKLDEERRLLYVAMTRARDRLTLFQPCARESYEAGVRRLAPCTPSRFLTPRLRACLDGDAAAADTGTGEVVYEYEDRQVLREPRGRYRW
jgi:DNA helicase-2/ATP-dependent DNA helicase PcrA